MPDPPRRPVRVVIVDDDPLVRSALGLMLGDHPDIDVIGEAADGRAGVALVAQRRPDVVLMDIRMPHLDGIEATRAIVQAAAAGRLAGSRPPARVVVLTTFDEDDTVLRALAAGAAGFLLKATPPAELVAAVRRVAAGDAILAPSSLAALLRHVRTSQPAAFANDPLAGTTDREREVAEAIGRGLANAEIASELYMSVATVKAHVTRLFEKLGVDNRVQIALAVHGIAIR